MRVTKIKRVLASITSMVGCLLLIYAFFFGDYEKTELKIEPLSDMGVEWQTGDYDGEGFPFSVNAHEGIPIVLTGTVPRNIPDNFGMVFYSLYSKCEVYIDGDRVYSYGGKQPLSMGHVTGNIRAVVPLFSSMEEKQVRIIITPYYSLHMDINPVLFGDLDAIKLNIVRENQLRFAIVACLATFMGAGVVLTFYTLTSKNHQNTKLYAYFSMFTLTVMLWIFFSSDMPQFITDANEAISIFSYLSLSFIPIPFLGFCANVFRKGIDKCEILQTIAWSVPILNIIGFCAKLFDPPEVLALSHISLIATSLLTLILAIVNYRSEPESRIMLTGVSVFIAGTLGGLICYFVAPAKGMAGTVAGISMALFIVALFVLILFRQISSVGERRYTDTINEVMLKDLQTGLLNRTAFNLEVEKIPLMENTAKEVTLMLFDICFLKNINDEEGFAVGDMIIEDVAKIIKNLMERYGTVYRINGDEFSVIVTKEDFDPNSAIERINESIADYNLLNNRSITLAKGYYRKTILHGKTYMRDVYRFADQALFADRQRIYNKK